MTLPLTPAPLKCFPPFLLSPSPFPLTLPHSYAPHLFSSSPSPCPLTLGGERMKVMGS